MSFNAKRQYADVTPDESLTEFSIKITRTHIIKYVGAGGDFQPIHHDEAFAKSIGLPSIFANGLMHGGMLSRTITDWAGDGVLTRYKLRFTGIVWPGDTLTFKGNVVKKYLNETKRLVDCRLTVVNHNGENVLDGEATVRLP